VSQYLLGKRWRAAAASLLSFVSVVYGAEGYTWRGAAASEAGASASSVSPGYGTTRPLEEELLVSVSVWGEVDAPGIYDVPDGTNVAELISYAGGPTEFANLSRVKLTRPGGGDAAGVDVKSYLARGDAATLPLLEPGDTVYVHRNAKYAWTTVIEVISQLAVVAGTALLYVEVVNRE
jgi:hypothetical protein